MNAQAPLFRFRPVSTPIHRVPANLKLAGMVCLTVAAFSPSIPVLLGVSAAIAALSIAARIGIPTLIHNARILLVYALFILIFRFAGPFPDGAEFLAGLRASGVYLWQLAAVLQTGTIFYETTSGMEIRHTLSAIQRALAALCSPLARPYVRLTGKDPAFPDVAFMLSLTINFIPRVFSAWVDLDRAWQARGGNRHRGIRATFRRFTVLVPALMASLLAIAADTAKAISNRSE